MKKLLSLIAIGIAIVSGNANAQQGSLLEQLEKTRHEVAVAKDALKVHLDRSNNELVQKYGAGPDGKAKFIELKLTPPIPPTRLEATLDPNKFFPDGKPAVSPYVADQRKKLWDQQRAREADFQKSYLKAKIEYDELVKKQAADKEWFEKQVLIADQTASSLKDKITAAVKKEDTAKEKWTTQCREKFSAKDAAFVALNKCNLFN